MSRVPHLLVGQRAGWKFGHQQVLDAMLHDGLWCATELTAMGRLADQTAARAGVSREEQDAIAVESHRRAAAAMSLGLFDAEIAPVGVAGGKGEAVVARDEGPRAGTTLEDLARLRPAFDPAGTVTAGNASQISDGAAAVVVASEEVACTIQTPVKARIVAAAVHSGPPRELFVAPVGAIEKVLARAGLRAGDIDLVELNEAFAAQCLACMSPLGLDPARVKVLGGAIALGHPIGASGARILVTLLHALAARGLRYGLAALCLGGGEAVALVVERTEAPGGGR
jgi:acetyl-CoA C-acetyltransferase